MADIKVDVALVLSQSKKASNELENVKHCIESLKRIYSDFLGDMKSNEFIKEFEESIEELIEQRENYRIIQLKI